MRHTRKQMARELMKMLSEGPGMSSACVEFTPEKAKEDVKLWLGSWIIPAVKRLVPELKEKKP